jgi:hypothetical protein
MIKITPEYLDGEEISKLWTAAQSNLRPAAAYKATVLLLQAQEPTRSPLPVLTRGLPIPGTERDEGVKVSPFLEPALPTLETVAPVSGQLVVRLGENTDLIGHHLDGASCTVLFGNDRFDIEHNLPAGSNEAGKVRFMIPIASANDYPVGLYRVGVSLVPPGESKARESNRLALTLAPQITGLPMNVARVAGTASFTINFHPALRAGQSAVLVLGQQEYEPEPFTAPVTSLNFVIEDAPPEAAPGHLVRLRIDGIDSPIIDRTAKPPTFLNQRIVIT